MIKLYLPQVAAKLSGGALTKEIIYCPKLLFTLCFCLQTPMSCLVLHLTRFSRQNGNDLHEIVNKSYGFIKLTLKWLLWKKINFGAIFKYFSLFEQWNKCDPVTLFKKQVLPSLCPSVWQCGPSRGSRDVLQSTSLFISFFFWENWKRFIFPYCMTNWLVATVLTLPYL